MILVSATQISKNINTSISITKAWVESFVKRHKLRFNEQPLLVNLPILKERLLAWYHKDWLYIQKTLRSKRINPNFQFCIIFNNLIKKSFNEPYKLINYPTETGKHEQKISYNLTPIKPCYDFLRT